MNENEIGDIVIKTAIEIHRELGPGLLETVYEVILAHELVQQGLSAQRQVSIPIEYQGIHFDEGFRADILIERKVILEIKSVKLMSDVHKKQLLTYLKLSGIKLGYLLNFGDILLKRGIKRIVNNLEE